MVRTCSNCKYWERIDTKKGICNQINSPDSMYIILEYDYANRRKDSLLATKQEGYCYKHEELNIFERAIAKDVL
jgi:hypothetical protein